jgi:hypothetical protein
LKSREEAEVEVGAHQCAQQRYLHQGGDKDVETTADVSVLEVKVE